MRIAAPCIGGGNHFAGQPYHIIIASVGSEKDADTMAQQLVAKGYAGAKVIIGDGKMRVSIQSCAPEKEAYRALNLIRQNEAYKSACILYTSDTRIGTDAAAYHIDVGSHQLAQVGNVVHEADAGGKHSTNFIDGGQKG